ncbi:hypothetical protein [Flavobacterium zepuense]|uniref:hypothetical protein n=1 Tax=Flavobacterium zepuense TaxID=2593302 RepID=UPI001F2B5D9F|nr:hypothetical protein [Flavobacterium zepuense]
MPLSSLMATMFGSPISATVAAAMGFSDCLSVSVPLMVPVWANAIALIIRNALLKMYFTMF